MVKFSIIIPLYNKENYITKTLQSVFKQTHTDFEVILVNDGSTDNSLNVVMNINDYRLKIYTKNNEGVSVARNYGIEKAQNDYIAFLDADDQWMPNYLESINNLIEIYPQAGAFATSYIINKNNIYESDHITKTNYDSIKTKLIDDYCKAILRKEVNLLWTGSICIKKKIFSEVGFFPIAVKRGEDLDMWLRISLKSNIAIMNSPIAIYNQISENNATRSYNSYKESFPYWKWYNYGTSKYLKRYTTKQIIALMRVALRNKRYNDVKILYFKIKGFDFILTRLVLFVRTFIKM